MGGLYAAAGRIIYHNLQSFVSKSTVRLGGHYYFTSNGLLTEASDCGDIASKKKTTLFYGIMDASGIRTV